MKIMTQRCAAFGEILRLLARLGLLCCVISINSRAASADRELVTLDNGEVSLAVDSTHGAIVNLRDKPSGTELEQNLPENFRLLILRPDGKTATVLGKNQKLSAIAQPAHGLNMSWDGPLTDTNGVEYAIAVRMNVLASGSELRFDLQLENHTTSRVKEVCYPFIGGLEKFGPANKPADAQLWLPMGFPKNLDKTFESQTFSYPGQMPMAFTCVQSAAANRSLYFASHDEVARYKKFSFEVHTNDTANHVSAYIQQLPFTAPGQAFSGSTVVIRFSEGDWHAGASVYRAWFDKTFGICKPAQSWLRGESFFFDTMFELPEGTINYRFKDIPRWARDAKAHGIKSVLISGWHVGGHDNGYPDYSPDPRLGTWKELEEGVKACHKLGLRVYFFVNYQPVMIDSDWYKRELYKYRDWPEPESGVAGNGGGWGMGTLWARMGHPKRMVYAEPGFPEFRQLLVTQFVKLAQIGADGVHVDKMFPAPLNFNPDLSLSPDTASWEGAITLTKEVFAACRRYKPDWAMSFECSWDRMMQFTCSTWWGGGFNRAVFPDSVGTWYVTSPYDYLGVNNLVCVRATAILGPMNYCRSLGWQPWSGLADYIREVKRIRDSLADAVWLGEELGQAGVQFDAPASCNYNVYRNKNTGMRVCILSNTSRAAKKEKLRGFIDGKTGQARVHVPFSKAKVVGLPAEIEVPGERIVFVEETSGAVFDQTGAIAESADNSRLPTAAFPAFDRKKSLKLEDDRYLVEVSRTSGAITRLRDKKADLEFIAEPRLADNFRFTLPIPEESARPRAQQLPTSGSLLGIEANYIWGKNQKLRSTEASESKLRLHWGKPLINYLGEKYDASALMEIELTPDGILFNLQVDNRTPYQVGEVFFPILGGLRGLGKTSGDLKQTLFIYPTATNVVASNDVFRVFANNPNSGLGDQGPEQFCSYPSEISPPRMAFFAPQLNRSVYLSTRPHSSVVARLEVLPGNSETMREDGNWPRLEEQKGLPVGVKACFVDFPNSPSNHIYNAPAVLLAFRREFASAPFSKPAPIIFFKPSSQAK
jgi:hypothetical protein